MKTLKFKLYKSHRNKHLKRSINAAGVIYNHCIALHKRYYQMWGKHLNCAKLQSHIAKRRKRKALWQQVGSQAVQDICQRIEKAYQHWNSRDIEGTVKTLTIKRTTLGELFMFVVVDSVNEPETKFETSKIAGFDFGLKTFLTVSDGTKIESPQFLKQSLNAIKKASRDHSLKRKGLANRERARLNLVRKHEDVVNRRSDWLWKLAHALTDRFDVLCFETLNLKGMQRLWGRKISDLAFGEFLKILEWVATKKGKQVIFIDRWYPSSKICSNCGHVLKELALEVREWRCPSCQSVNGRDENAALNIQRVGASTLKLGDVRQAMPAIAV